jgi:hypothetical protein
MTRSLLSGAAIAALWFALGWFLTLGLVPLLPR